jgi:hypothetical protein
MYWSKLGSKQVSVRTGLPFYGRASERFSFAAERLGCHFMRPPFGCASKTG